MNITTSLSNNDQSNIDLNKAAKAITTTTLIECARTVNDFHIRYIHFHVALVSYLISLSLSLSLSLSNKAVYLPDITSM